MGYAADCVQHVMQSPFLLVTIHSFVKSIGVEDQFITRIQGEVGGLESELW